jgi:hypothetical protein
MKMQRYEHRGGDTGVVAYATGPRGIAVQFVDGSVYVYDIERPGRAHVAEMKRLAKAGQGLSGYISREVRDCYAKKLR